MPFGDSSIGNNMKTISDLVNSLKVNWSTGRKWDDQGRPLPFELVCEFEKPTDSYSTVSLDFPDELIELWRSTGTCRLFKDTQYSQWGLELLSPEEATTQTADFRAKRSTEFLTGDLVIGNFFGDADSLLIRCDRSNTDFGSVMVVPPLDPRNEWHAVGSTLSVFLNSYAASPGAKFWE